MTLGLTDKISPYKHKFGPFPGDIYRVPFPNALDGISIEDALAALDLLFRTDADPERIPAMVIEPVQGEGSYYIVLRISPGAAPDLQPARHPPDRRRVRLLARRQVVRDRAQQRRPELIAVAKEPGRHLPFVGVIGRAEIMDAVPRAGLAAPTAAIPWPARGVRRDSGDRGRKSARTQSRARGGAHSRPAEGDPGQELELAALHQRGTPRPWCRSGWCRI
jgi:4-aminobutyrate aminotransferase/(S)-3-amino-2-methylpropionate transaminase